jgi:hypothetical protein
VVVVVVVLLLNTFLHLLSPARLLLRQVPALTRLVRFVRLLLEQMGVVVVAIMLGERAVLVLVELLMWEAVVAVAVTHLVHFSLFRGLAGQAS